MRRYLRRRSGNTAAGCASVNGIRLLRRRLPRDNAHAEVAPDPFRSETIGQVDAPSGVQPWRFDLQYVQSERIRDRVLLAHFLPPVEPPAHRSGLAQRDREPATFGQLLRRSLLGPDDARESRAFSAVA